MYPTSLESALALGPSATLDGNHVRKRIAESQSKISGIDTQIRDLQSRRATEHSNLVSLQHLTAPNSLPPELLGEIFSLSTVPVDCHISSYGRGKDLDITSLSQVCHYWRQVAHSTPGFWTQCSIKVKPVARETHVAGIKAWLDRSSDLPLTLSFTSDSVDANIRAWAGALMPSISHRVKTLELRLSSFASLETLFAHRMESLETLNVSAMGGSQQTIESLTHEVDLAVIAPRLTVVMLGDNYPDMSTIPWGRLTVLHLSDAPTHCLDLFLQCANLKEASLFTGEWPDLANVPDRPVTLLPHLRSLQFVMDYGDDWDADGGHAEQFLQPLALPALTSLQLSLGGRPLSSAQISPFLLRSPNIQDLDLVLSEISSEDLVGVLRSTPALTYLRLCMCFTCIDDSSLGALQYRENDADPLVPLLEHLHWDNILGVFEGASLEAMLRSRWWPAGLQSPYAAQSSPRVARLGNIYMSFQSGMNLDINGLKAKMQDCGDDIYICGP